MNNKELTIANQIAETINSRGIKADIMIKDSNGVEHLGFTMGNGNVRSTIYIRVFEDTNVNEMANNLITKYNEIKNNTSDGLEEIVSQFSNFEVIRKNIIPCLVKYASIDKVSRNYLDLKITYRWFIYDNGNGDMGSVVIKKQHLDMWGITEEELFRIAKENVKDLFEDIDVGIILGVPTGMLRVVSYKNKRPYGATALLFPELFERYGNNIRILPSSIHEVLVVVGSSENVNDNGLIDMITSVNQTQLLPEEILSDHPYTYMNGEIKEVG